ncbi:hypothetical protein QBC39DRAFT_376887 [Podospora conica]|nr:hypothetical protein QBC39DRAFT_376887 [Schizothecium conicum]
MGGAATIDPSRYSRPTTGIPRPGARLNRHPNTRPAALYVKRLLAEKEKSNKDKEEEGKETEEETEEEEEDINE